MLDNIGVMILMGSLLVAAFNLPGTFVLTRMIPGTAVGVLVGDLIYTAMAFRLARRTGRTDVTAMPLGLDTPSTFGSVFLIIGPAYQDALRRGLNTDMSARHAWFVGITMLIASGFFKFACAPFSGWIRKSVPRAGLLGSLAAIALVLISFLPSLDIAAHPVVGVVAMGLMLATLTARWQFPRQIPGALGAVAVGCLVYYGLYQAGWGPGPRSEGGAHVMSLRAVLPMPFLDWLDWFLTDGRDAIRYLPVAIPLALATVVGGIDCTESASTVGDDYPTGQIIAAEGLATLVGGIFGGVIQSTPYIGHPAYKAMGARSAYTLATALFVGAAGIFGFFDWIFFFIPKAVIFPILIFVGLEITSQSFHATAVRHYPAVALACVPALAYLAVLAYKKRLAGSAGVRGASPVDPALDTNGDGAGRRWRIHRHQPLVGDCAGTPDRRPDSTSRRHTADRGCFFLVWRHSLTVGGQPDQATGSRHAPARGRGTCRSHVPANTLSLGGRLRPAGRRAPGAATGSGRLRLPHGSNRPISRRSRSSLTYDWDTRHAMLVGYGRIDGPRYNLFTRLGAIPGSDIRAEQSTGVYLGAGSGCVIGILV